LHVTNKQTTLSSIFYRAYMQAYTQTISQNAILLYAKSVRLFVTVLRLNEFTLR